MKLYIEQFYKHDSTERQTKRLNHIINFINEHLEVTEKINIKIT
jgi:hypothetical protein